jgi:hypothetical protein
MIDDPGYLLLNLVLAVRCDDGQLQTAVALTTPTLAFGANVAPWVACRLLGPNFVIEWDRKPPLILRGARLCRDATHRTPFKTLVETEARRAGLAATMASGNTALETQTLK